MSRYLYLTRLTRPAAFDHPTEEESAIVGTHFAHLKAATEAGLVLLAGPCLDGAFGIVLFEAASDEAARAFMASDPAIQGGVMAGELHPIRISLAGKITPDRRE
jgi:uncharacterized protein YciI